MKTKLTWKKGIFSDTYKIYTDGQLTGKLKNNFFSETASGELNGVKYTFRNKGFLKCKTLIIEDQSNNIVGEIAYNMWMTKATLSTQNEETYWKSDNILNAKWSISNSKGIQINYSGTSGGGNIESDIDSDLLMLTGLVVSNYYWQIAAVVILIICISI
jgi:hypothetical protein